MARFEIVLTDEDRDVEDLPWSAGLWQMDDYGRSGDLLANGEGRSALSALSSLRERITEGGGETWRLLTAL